MRVPFTNLKIKDQKLSSNIEIRIKEIIKNSEFILGEDVKKFEEEFAKFCSAKYCVGVASGTDGLTISLKALGINCGDEIITAANSFISTALSISFNQATPVFADIDPKTYNIDTSEIEKKITKKTKALLPVCLYGHPINFIEIEKIAKKYKLKVIIDACQSHGATFNNKPLGKFADAVVFSFYPTKNLGGYGDSGAVVTNNKAVAQKIVTLRNIGRKKWHTHIIKGYNSRLDNIQAAVLRLKLKHLNKWNNLRREKAHLYNKLLKDLPVITPIEINNSQHVYYLYTIRTKKRDKLKNFLTKKGIDSAIYYPIPIHLQRAYAELNLKRGSLPQTEKAASEILSLPLYPEITKSQLHFVAKSIREFFRNENY